MLNNIILIFIASVLKKKTYAVSNLRPDLGESAYSAQVQCRGSGLTFPPQQLSIWASSELSGSGCLRLEGA